MNYDEAVKRYYKLLDTHLEALVHEIDSSEIKNDATDAQKRARSNALQLRMYLRNHVL
jgi:hypothetical protein